MTRRGILIALITMLSIMAVLGWVGAHLEREIKEIHIGFQGEAKTNPLLAARHFAKRMGIPSETLPSLLQVDRLPAAGDTLLIGTKRATFIPEQHRRLLDWVARGGHLILAARQTNVHSNQANIEDDLLKRVGIAVVADGSTDSKQEEHPILKIYPPQTEAPLHVKFNRLFSLKLLDAHPDFILEDAQGIRLIHARHGSGHVTVLSDLGFLYNDHIGELDHAEFFYHLLRLGGDSSRLWLVHNEDMPPLWEWLWEHAWSLIISMLTLLGAWLATKMTRFGPLLAVPTQRRRRLLEHLDASGHFLWNQGQKRYLINSVQSALERRLLAHHPGWAALSPIQRENILAKINRFSKQHIHTLLHAPAPDDALSFTRRIKLLESIRRKL